MLTNTIILLTDIQHTVRYTIIDLKVQFKVTPRGFN